MIDRVLITGGAGFIGSHLVCKLTRNGTEVHVLFDADKDISRITDLGEKIKFYKVTSWRYDELRSVLSDINPKTIFHLRAAINNDLSANEDSIYKINFEDTKELAKAASRLPSLSAFIHTGTIAEYGGAPSPFCEDGPALPISYYGRSKLAATELLKEFYRSTNFPVTVLRLSLVYGPRQKSYSLIPRVIASCLKKQDFYVDAYGLQTRDPLFVGDAVEGFLLAAHSKYLKGEIINLGLGKEYAIVDIANMINDLLGKPIKILTKDQPNRIGENDHYWHDITKASRVLGWSPKISLVEGLKKTISWYKTQYEQNKSI